MSDKSLWRWGVLYIMKRNQGMMAERILHDYGDEEHDCLAYAFYKFELMTRNRTMAETVAVRNGDA